LAANQKVACSSHAGRTTEINAYRIANTRVSLDSPINSILLWTGVEGGKQTRA